MQQVIRGWMNKSVICHKKGVDVVNFSTPEERKDDGRVHDNVSAHE